jgi:arsenite methyltransferase
VAQREHEVLMQPDWKTQIVKRSAKLTGFVARQLGHPQGWFGRTVLTRILNRGNNALIEAALDALHVESAQHLLDIGFGGGAALRLAAQRMASGRLTGVDASSDAVAFVEADLKALVESGRLALCVGDVRKLPFQAAGFDRVLSTNTVYFWPDLAAAVQEIRRVSLPGARLCLGFSDAPKMRQFDAITRHGFLLRSADEVERAVADAGFSHVEVLRLDGARTKGDVIVRGIA